jgi:hypothetical protein
VRSLLRQAERNVESGKYVAAEELYRQIVDESPQSAAGWLGLSKVARNESDREEAYARALDLAPEIVVEPVESSPDVEEAPADAGSMHAPAPVEAQPVQPEVQTVVDEAPEYHYEVVLDSEEQLFCYRHPNRSTSLRCYKCNKPICSECTVKTPVGYLCPDCYREAEDAFFNAKPMDYLLAALVALPISLLAGFLVMQFSRGIFFIIIMFFVGGFIGGVIGRVTKRVIGGRRGRYIPHLVAACVIIGVLIWALPVLMMGPGVLFALIGPGVYLATAVGSAYYWAR